MTGVTVDGGPYRGSGRPGEPVERRPGAAARIPADPRGESRRQRLVALAWLAGWELARRLPERLVFVLADLGGRVHYHLVPATRDRVRRNLARVAAADPAIDDLDAAVRAALRSYARYWIEAFRAADLDPAELDARTTTGGFRHLDAALERGAGVVVLLAHHGSWDVAARWAETHGYHLAVVAEVVRPRRLFERFVRLRETMGLEVVPLRRREVRAGARSGGALVTALAPALEGNHLVGLLADRDLTGTAPVVELFGEPARMPRGPAVLAARSGAAVIPISMLQRPGRRWHLQVLPEIDLQGCTVEEATQRIARGVEDLVRLDPVQWHCVSPIWLADAPARR